MLATKSAIHNKHLATGGTVTSYTTGGNTYRAHTFLSSGTFQVYNKSITCDVLVVAGGGSGGWGNTSSAGHGGGGAGGFRTKSYSGGSKVPAGSYAVTVGEGAVPSSTTPSIKGTNQKFDYTNVPNYMQGSKGEDSTFHDVTSTGGGGGGSGTDFPGGDGGSGGGTGYSTSPGNGITFPVTSPAQGYNGGSTGTGSPHAAAGGGGASQIGQVSGSNSVGGAGGAGATNNYRTSSNVTYAGGGGGAGGLDNAGNHTGGAGGSGIGGAGVGKPSGSMVAAGHGDINTGSGGGGGGGGTAAGNGGSGIVVIRYQIS